MIVKLALFAVSAGIGLLMAFQPAINADLARRTGSASAAAMVSLLISVAAVLPLVLATRGFTALPMALGAPWWVLLGGLAGAAFVTGGILVGPAIGIVAFLGCVLLGQALGAVAVDQFGLFGMARRPLDLRTSIALALVIGGFLLLVTRPR